MEKLVCFWFLIAPLFTVPDSAFAQQNPIYVEVGKTIVLRPPASKPTENILWKYGDRLVAEWLGSEVEYYREFIGRTTLDTKTGVLEIKNATADDTAIYTVEIDNKIQDERRNVKVIEKVPKPEVAFRPLSCSFTFTDCSLTCYGETTGAEPVTYTWWKGEGEWTQTGKDVLIMNNEEFQSVKTFSCQMKNPVSEKKSETHENPFYKEPSSGNGVGLGLGLFFLILSLIVLGGVVGYTQRYRILKMVHSLRAGNAQPVDPSSDQPPNERPTDNVQPPTERPTDNVQPPNEKSTDNPVNNGKPEEAIPLKSEEEKPVTTDEV